MPQTTAADWGYARVSSEEQARGQSIDGQVRRIIDSGIPPERIVQEVESATKGKTKLLFKLFQQAREGKVKSILSIRQDRFQRTRKVEAQMWELIDEHDVKFRFLDQTDIDKDDPTSTFQARITGASAQFETELLRQRVMNGLRENKLKKKHHGRAPWGYVCREGRLIPDTNEWDSARAVIECYLQTGSSTEARRLKYELTGKPMGPSSFGRWIQGHNIRGAVVYNSRSDTPEIHWGQHPALLQPHEWDAIQNIRAKNKVTTGAFRKVAKAPTIGSGLFRCAECGKALSFVNNAKRTVSMYRCRTIKGAGCSQGHTNWVKLHDVPDILRFAIQAAALEIADTEVPYELPEPPELSALKDERDTYLKMDTLRSTKMAAELQEEITAMEQRMHTHSHDRFAAVRSEFEALTDEAALNELTDEQLRSLAVRYGLTMKMDDKQLAEIEWQHFGSKLILHPEGYRDESGKRVIATGIPGKQRELSEEMKDYLWDKLKS